MTTPPPTPLNRELSLLAFNRRVLALAEVYLAMTRGQDTLTIDIAAPGGLAGAGDAALPAGGRAALKVIAPTAEELAAHAEYLAALDAESRGRCLWLRFGAAAGTTA